MKIMIANLRPAAALLFLAHADPIHLYVEAAAASSASAQDLGLDDALQNSKEDGKVREGILTALALESEHQRTILKGRIFNRRRRDLAAKATATADSAANHHFSEEMEGDRKYSSFFAASASGGADVGVMTSIIERHPRFRRMLESRASGDKAVASSSNPNLRSMNHNLGKRNLGVTQQRPATPNIKVGTQTTKNCPAGCPEEVCQCIQGTTTDPKLCIQATVNSCRDGSFLNSCHSADGDAAKQIYSDAYCTGYMCLDDAGILLDTLDASGNCELTVNPGACWECSYSKVADPLCEMYSQICDFYKDDPEKAAEYCPQTECCEANEAGVKLDCFGTAAPTSSPAPSVVKMCPAGCPQAVCDCNDGLIANATLCSQVLTDSCDDGTYAGSCAGADPTAPAFSEAYCVYNSCTGGQPLTPDGMCDPSQSDKCVECLCSYYTNICDNLTTLGCATGIENCTYFDTICSISECCQETGASAKCIIPA